ncbi:PEP-CTERM sorting domain-containing protein [Aeoliella sp. SH292]|uniref:PEP-CTERM sorting domain-containing protein n=1 Tax=Aeoliella sp. SH292 TaxID=3454464 RepID=UPI003F99A6BC
MRDTLNRTYGSLSQVLFLALLSGAVTASASTVVIDSPFVNGFGGWTDTFTGTPSAGAKPNWGVLLTEDQTLIESSDGRAGDGTTTSGVANGRFTPFVMVDTSVATPATYEINALLGTYGDDGYGVVFGYTDNNNYFRATLRQQAGSTFGTPTGVSVQKVVGGVITQLGVFPGFTPTIGSGQDNLTVRVNGTAWDVLVNGESRLNGADADLQPGSYGVFSWGQRRDAPGARAYGSSFESISVTSDTVNQTTSFADVLPFEWRPLRMTNSANIQGIAFDDYGNFRQDFRNGSILDDSDGFEWATTETPNVDFIGPAVVLNEPNMASLSDYQLNVRMQNGDDDGIGLLVRVADDGTFYRINFARQVLGTAATAHQRAPRGMSIQKYANGDWTELFRDNQDTPAFLFTENQPFDVSVDVIGNSIAVSVIDDPDGLATLISYAPVIDGTDPILAGSVGLTNWGSGPADSGVIYSAFGGGGTAFLIAVPEPSTIVLAALAFAALMVRCNRRPNIAA